MLFVTKIVIIISGINITSAFVNIFATSRLVMYSSSIFNISNLLLNFNTYLFMNGTLEKNIYNFCPEQEHKALLGAVDEMLNL